MRMLPDMDRRLLNWARYVRMMQAGGRFATGSMEARVDGEGWDAPTVIRPDDAEAEVTQVAVLAMRGELRAASQIWYLGSGGIAHKASRLCCSETTLRERVGQAHRALAQWLADKASMDRRERERVEGLQRVASVSAGGT